MSKKDGEEKKAKSKGEKSEKTEKPEPTIIDLPATTVEKIVKQQVSLKDSLVIAS